MIFADGPLVLAALRFSSADAIVLRNSAFAESGSFRRLALTPALLVKAGLGVGTVLPALAATVAYHCFAPALPDESAVRAKGSGSAGPAAPSYQGLVTWQAAPVVAM